jgi:hypothetical protein
MNYKNTLVATVLMHSGPMPPGARWMLESAARYGVEVFIVGQGLAWENFYTSKLVRLYEATRKLTGYDFMVFVDGDDTLFATGLEEMHERFAKFDAPFVISGDPGCWPWPQRYGNITPHALERFRYVNAGFYMASWEGYLATLEAVMNLSDDGYEEQGRTIRNDDQAAFSRAYIEGLTPIAVDHRCELSQCLNGLDGPPLQRPSRYRRMPIRSRHIVEGGCHGHSASGEIEWGKRPRNRITNTFPCTFHANGIMKDRLKDLRQILCAS